MTTALKNGPLRNTDENFRLSYFPEMKEKMKFQNGKIPNLIKRQKLHGEKVPLTGQNWSASTSLANFPQFR